MVAMGENENLAYLVPSDGALLFVDNLAIPSSSSKVDAAHQFINFLLRPEISAQISNFTYYGTCNGEAWDDVEEFLREGPPFQTPDEDKTYFLEDVGEFGETYDRAWTEVKIE
jgi:spermidine/putrescine-binding protein